MKYNRLGGSALEVSEICLGTMTFGEQNSEEEAHQQLDYALSRGVNFFDAAEMYAVPPRAETQGLGPQDLEKPGLVLRSFHGDSSADPTPGTGPGTGTGGRVYHRGFAADRAGAASSSARPVARG